MQKWIVAAILYLATVIGGYTIYEISRDDEKPAVSEEGHGGMDASGTKMKAQEMGNETQEQHGHEEEGSHEHGSGATEGSGVNVFVQADAKEMKIFLKDLQGNPVKNLEITHEKLMHLIIVDENLEEFYHLHPEQIGDGEFIVEHTLPEGLYKAFIDIKLKDESYQVSPIPFVLGEPKPSDHSHGLVKDDTLTQTVDGETVELEMSTFYANKPVTLTFNLDKTNLAPYLGAMGHVVILDEGGKNYLHVHPENDVDTIFQTEFSKPGTYKIWAQFNQNGKIRTFPYVVEIK